MTPHQQAMWAFMVTQRAGMAKQVTPISIQFNDNIKLKTQEKQDAQRDPGNWLVLIPVLLDQLGDPILHRVDDVQDR